MAAQAQDPAGLEEIVVTGSRIARANVVSSSPVTQLNSEELTFSGTVNVEDLLNDLPQVVAGLTSATNNGNNGTATVDLRGLGTNRTLVLVNGRRFVGSSQDGTVDLNNIPAALIERVEVVSGGASAVYGSDAISGVVNFILKDDFEGVQADLNYGISDRGDAKTYDASVTMGGNFADGRGNAVVSVGYLNRDSLLQGARSFSRDTYTDSSGALELLGSTTTPSGRIDAGSGLPDDAPYAFLPDGTIRPFQGGTANSYGDTYNFAPDNYLQTPQKRYNLAAMTTYDLADNIEAYAEAFYVNSQVNTQLAATPVTGIIVQADNPFLSAQARQVLANRADPDAPIRIRRRTTEVGPRNNQYESQTYRFVTGLRGDFEALERTWDWDAYYNYGRVVREEQSTGLVATSRFQAAVDCYGANATPGCVPLNPFGPDTISPEAAAYVTVPARDRTVVQQEVLGASISGEVFDLPAGPVGVALGGEYRQEKSSYSPDFFASTGDLQGGTNAGPVSGSFDVYEIFGEVAVPLLSGLAYVEDLSVEAGFRYSDYSNIGSVTTWKAGGSYSPIDEVRLRAIYQRAIRAPSISELYGAAQQSFEPVSDPCSASSNPSAAVLAVCQQQGLPAGLLGTFEDDGQIEVTFVGNPDLQEEKSDTWTFGAVVDPTDWLTLSVDYYNIKIEDAIQTFGGGLGPALAACYASGDANSAACSPLGQPIRRDSTGEIIPFDLPQANISDLKTDGVDFQADARFDLPNGHGLSANVLVTWVNSYEFTPNPAQPAVYEYAGTISTDDSAIPDWKINARVTYDGGPWSLSYRFRWINAVEHRAFADAEAIGDPAPVLAVEEVGSVVYSDISGQYRISDNITLTAGVNNVFDRNPPILPDTISANTDTNTYDVLGRYFFMNASIRF